MGKGVQYSGDPVILGIRRSLLHVTHRPAPLSVIFPACTPLPTTLRAHSPSSTVNIQCVALKMMRTAPWKSGCTASACVSALTARDSSCVTIALLGTKYSYPLTAECVVLTELFQCYDAVFNHAVFNPPKLCGTTARSHISVVGVAHCRRRASLLTSN